MAFLDFLIGAPGRTQQTPRFSPAQLGLQNAALQQAQNILGQGQSGFEPIAERARQQFRTRTIPTIAERFSAMGGTPGGSSGFAGLLGEAATGLETDLVAQAAHYQQSLLNQLLSAGLQPQFDTQYVAGQPGLLSQLFPAGLNLAGSYFPGAGQGISSLLSNLLGGSQQPVQNLGPQGQTANPILPGIPVSQPPQFTSSALNQPILQNLGFGQLSSRPQAAQMAQQGGLSNILGLLRQSSAAGLGL